ncbi:gamma subclass chorismate mutase AroQ [Ruegeria sp. Ofav3-42]|uniref:gamma subclass chorismate mutase AroQ n=1 Tax=Ruegeria sp. Ofav3-42 TaxID=2917759 RepID=UPI001EF6B4B9|nr:gamma subclass chorismate mutase AroQ [Ruegeria sp. Ofav3-42]MCG7518383.1 gamma subclass chorismate mutase AroQ [Ruegeria sp. Ofav3-42]
MIAWGKPVCLCLLIAGTATPAQAELFDLIDSRLEWMQDVAAFKHANDRPVEDLEREKVVIQKTLEQAALAGVDPDTAQLFFKAQIDAAKDIQSCWIERWTQDQTPVPENFADLTTEVRPALLELGGQILEALSAQLPVSPSSQAEFSEDVRVDCLSDDSRAELFDSLTKVRLAQ